MGVVHRVDLPGRYLAMSGSVSSPMGDEIFDGALGDLVTLRPATPP